MHIRVTLEPAIVVGLVGVEIVEDHMDCGVRVVSDYIVHEVEELDAPAAIFVRGRDLAGGHLKSSKQGRSAVALVIVTMAGQSPAHWRGITSSVSVISSPSFDNFAEPQHG